MSPRAARNPGLPADGRSRARRHGNGLSRGTALARARSRAQGGELFGRDTRDPPTRRHAPLHGAGTVDGCKATEASDQYALGVALRELAPGGDVDFAAICARATAPDPARRYAGMDAMLDDLRRFLAHRPVAANPPSLFRRLRLFARRNPLAASGIVAASILLAAFVAALAVGYMKTSRALAATEQEAASAAQSLAKAVAEIDRTDSDRRDAEIVRALTAAEHLASRFPGNAEIADAVERLKAARDAHARFLERRGGAMRLQHRFRSALRHEQ